MNGFIGKIGRLAVSKAAGFGYAVAVGVAGNLTFNYLQPHQPAAAIAPAVPAASAPVVAPSVASRSASPAAPAVAAAPAPPARRMHMAPAASPITPVISAPVLPEPPAGVALPSSDALPIPVLKPAALPLENGPLENGPLENRPLDNGPLEKRPIDTRPSEAAAPAAALSAATTASEPAAAASPASAALPPLGPAIDVAPPPSPPPSSPTVAVEAAPSPPQLASVRPTAAPPSRVGEARSDFAISDVWHPGRAVRKGLHWAGRQVPLIGDAEPAPHAARSAPMPLVPSTRDAAGPAEGAPPHKLTAPGPGSGGLY